MSLRCCILLFDKETNNSSFCYTQTVVSMLLSKCSVHNSYESDLKNWILNLTKKIYGQKLYWSYLRTASVCENIHFFWYFTLYVFSVHYNWITNGNSSKKSNRISNINWEPFPKCKCMPKDLLFSVAFQTGPILNIKLKTRRKFNIRIVQLERNGPHFSLVTSFLYTCIDYDTPFFSIWTQTLLHIWVETSFLSMLLVID